MTNILIGEVRLVLFLLGRQVQDLLFNRRVIFENVTLNVQVLPANEDFHAAQLEGLQRVLDAKTVLARVLANLVKVTTCKRIQISIDPNFK